MKLLLSVRHVESAANVDKKVNRVMPDNMIPASEEGLKQGLVAAEELKKIFKNFDVKQARLYYSPYLRTKQTKELLLSNKYVSKKMNKIQESILLREQEFGKFDGLEDHEIKEIYPHESEHYNKLYDNGGKFFARFPDGESRCDVAERVKLMFDTFHRDFRKGIECIVVVAHGVTNRCLRKEWMGYDVEWIDNEKNPGNASIHAILYDDKKGKYIDLGYLFEGFHKITKQELHEDGVIAADEVVSVKP